MSIPFRMDFLQANQHIIHYNWIDNHKPRTFLFINALGTDYRIWDEVVKQLTGYANILLFDKRGHGLSDVVATTRTLEDFADDAEALLKHIKINRCVVVGLSVGGMIAQVLADRIPNHIEKLVLCDTRHKIGNEPIWNDRINTINEKGLCAISEGIMQRWFSNEFRSNVATTVSACRNMVERCPVMGYIKTCEAIRDADLTTMANNINIPTLCVVGSEDKSTLPQEVKDLADLIDNSKFEVIKGSGHLPCVDNPGVLTKIIVDFLG